MQGFEVVLPLLDDVLYIIIDLTMNQRQRGTPNMDVLLMVVEEFVPSEETVGELLSCFFELVQFDSLAENGMAELTWKREEACLSFAHGFGFGFGDESEDVCLGVAFELAFGEVPCDSCH